MANECSGRCCRVCFAAHLDITPGQLLLTAVSPRCIGPQERQKQRLDYTLGPQQGLALEEAERFLAPTCLGKLCIHVSHGSLGVRAERLLIRGARYTPRHVAV